MGDSRNNFQRGNIGKIYSDITENRYLYLMILKNELREKGWTQRDLPPEVLQPSFLRGDESDAQLGFKFE